MWERSRSSGGGSHKSFPVCIVGDATGYGAGMGEAEPDPMDVDKVLECLNRALVLQQRSVLQFTLGAGSMFGLEYQAVGSELWRFARAGEA
jgi:hypothetical protein